jgi:hypothetical protein
MSAPSKAALALAQEVLRPYCHPLNRELEEAARRIDAFAAASAQVQNSAAQDKAEADNAALLDFLDAEAKRRGCDLAVMERRGDNICWAGIEWGEETSVRAGIEEARAARKGGT